MLVHRTSHASVARAPPAARTQTQNECRACRDAPSFVCVVEILRWINATRNGSSPGEQLQEATSPLSLSLAKVASPLFSVFPCWRLDLLEMLSSL